MNFEILRFACMFVMYIKTPTLFYFTFSNNTLNENFLTIKTSSCQAILNVIISYK